MAKAATSPSSRPCRSARSRRTVRATTSRSPAPGLPSRATCPPPAGREGMARVLLFGPLRDLAGWRERQVAATSLAELRSVLAAEDPELGVALAGKGVQIAVDQVI